MKKFYLLIFLLLGSIYAQGQCQGKKFHIAANPLIPDSCNGGVLCLYDQNEQIITSLEGYDVIWSDGETGQCNGITAANQNTMLCAYITKYSGNIPNSPIICRDTVCEFVRCDSCSLGNLVLQPMEYHPTPCDTSYFRVLLNGIVVNAANYPHISLTWPDGSHGTVYGPVFGGVCVKVQEWDGVPFESNIICERQICYTCCRSFHIDFDPQYGTDVCEGAQLCLYDDVTNQIISNYPQYNYVTWSNGVTGPCTWVNEANAPEICAYINPPFLRNCRDTICKEFICKDSCTLSGYTLSTIKTNDPCENAYFVVLDPSGNIVFTGGNISFLWNDGSTNFIYGPVSFGACVEITLWSGVPHESKKICTVKICYDCHRGNPRSSSIDDLDDIEIINTATSLRISFPENIGFDKLSMSNMLGNEVYKSDVFNQSDIEISTTELPAGLYILQFKSEIGGLAGIRKVIIVK